MQIGAIGWDLLSGSSTWNRAVSLPSPHKKQTQRREGNRPENHTPNPGQLNMKQKTKGPNQRSRSCCKGQLLKLGSGLRTWFFAVLLLCCVIENGIFLLFFVVRHRNLNGVSDSMLLYIYDVNEMIETAWFGVWSKCFCHALAWKWAVDCLNFFEVSSTDILQWTEIAKETEMSEIPHRSIVPVPLGRPQRGRFWAGFPLYIPERLLFVKRIKIPGTGSSTWAQTSLRMPITSRHTETWLQWLQWGHMVNWLVIRSALCAAAACELKLLFSQTSESLPDSPHPDVCRKGKGLRIWKDNTFSFGTGWVVTKQQLILCLNLLHSEIPQSVTFRLSRSRNVHVYRKRKGLRSWRDSQSGRFWKHIPFSLKAD